MKLATYQTADGPALGVVLAEKGQIINAAAACTRLLGARHHGQFGMLGLIESGATGMALLRRLPVDEPAIAPFALDLASVKLLAPLPVPPQIRDCSVFAQHVSHAPLGMQRLRAALEGRAVGALPEPTVPDVSRAQPVWYISNRFSVVGHDAVVRWPGYSRVMDFELEVAVVIGTGGADIPEAKARDHIFGYTIMNDFSARDQQQREMEGRLGPTKGKSFDTGNAIGPWIVTADEVPDPYALPVAVRVNGEEWVRTTTAGMLHSYEQIIAFISRNETLHPGEIIAGGTVGGCCGLELGRFLPDGAVVELDVGGIGVLRNKVVANAQAGTLVTRV
ncbi:MAG TPA: fumarylacetoacetate hydrolase family protein [Acetobacteraceae bacterium]|jgi:2-keto-4-pentenoate hydratase/2-oxohepta-3-ene-1,7-dioic acid hydratase in catechol pathway|nr:fumarylacetoacetate hydrolase family protein [Acetobacteraceae bacterium]